MQQRVTVFNTVGANDVTIDFEGSTKSELTVAMANAGISFDNMAFKVMETEVTLESANAQTPELAEWTLFMVPVKVDSGFNDDASFDNDDDEEEYEEFETPAVVAPAAVLSPETLGYIKNLESTITLLQTIIAKLRTDVITDPRKLELIRRAALMQANSGK